MQTIAYYLLLGLFKALGMLPMRALYGLSGCLYGLLYHVLRYRRKVVRQNLLRVFPDRGEAFRLETERRFYHFLCDLVVEVFKMMAASPEEMHQRIRFAHPEIWNEQFARGKMALIVTGHYGNWEWLATTRYTVDYPFISLYHVLHNPVFERLVLHLRTRFGTEMISMKVFYRKLLSCIQQQQPTSFGFIADQAPKHMREQQWMPFLGQDTQVYNGVEKLARKYDCAVIYLSIRRLERGRYLIEDTLVTGDGASTPPGWVTAETMRLLEEDILRAPEFWLWSHKRWKYSRDAVKETK